MVEAIVIVHVFAYLITLGSLIEGGHQFNKIEKVLLALSVFVPGLYAVLLCLAVTVALLHTTIKIVTYLPKTIYNWIQQ